MKAVVSSVIEPFSQRVSKAGKKYSAMRAEVELEDGSVEVINIFQDKAIGEQLELIKKGEYWNVLSQRDAEENTRHKEVMDALRKIYEMQSRIYKELKK